MGCSIMSVSVIEILFEIDEERTQLFCVPCSTVSIFWIEIWFEINKEKTRLFQCRRLPGVNEWQAIDRCQ